MKEDHTYEEGKSYILKTGEVMRIEMIGEETCILRLLTKADGKIPDEEDNQYLEGLSHRLQRFMVFMEAKEIKHA